MSTRFFDPQASDYRRGGNRLVGNDGVGYKAEVTVEWQRLAIARVEALDAILAEHPQLTIIPDPYYDPEKDYRVRLGGGYDFVNTVPSNWNLGKSGTVVFREV